MAWGEKIIGTFELDKSRQLICLEGQMTSSDWATRTNKVCIGGEQERILAWYNRVSQVEINIRLSSVLVHVNVLRARWSRLGGSGGALTCMLGPRRLLCCWCCRWANASLGLFTPAILAWCLRSWMSSRVSSSGCSQARISEEWENILENHLGSHINRESQMVERPVYFRKILINKNKKKKPCSMKATAAFWTLRGQFIVVMVIRTGITNEFKKISQWH